MRQAADILASPAAMQIRQLEALQVMARTANSKVVFVPMSLQTDIGGQLAGGSRHGGGGGGMSGIVQQESGEDVAGRAGLLTSVADI
jgi:erythrocyte band 7 integral membrane protein